MRTMFNLIALKKIYIYYFFYNTDMFVVCIQFLVFLPASLMYCILNEAQIVDFFRFPIFRESARQLSKKHLHLRVQKQMC